MARRRTLEESRICIAFYIVKLNQYEAETQSKWKTIKGFDLYQSRPDCYPPSEVRRLEKALQGAYAEARALRLSRMNVRQLHLLPESTWAEEAERLASEEWYVNGVLQEGDCPF
jgi:hypothetical protein